MLHRDNYGIKAAKLHKGNIPSKLKGKIHRNLTPENITHSQIA